MLPGWLRTRLLCLSPLLVLAPLLVILLPRSSTPRCTSPPPPLTSLHDLLPLAEREDKCRVVGLLRTMYRVEEEGTPLVFPKALQMKMKGWLGGDEELFKGSITQRVLQVTDRLSGESTHYNPLRALRPQPLGAMAAGREWAMQEVERTRKDCDFCQPLNYTAGEPWGRVSLAGCVSSANVFRVAGPTTGIILSRTHSVLDVGQELLGEMLQCCLMWYRKVHQTDPGLLYPMLIWDVFPKAGASQTHPHFQTWLGRSGYSGDYAALLRKANLYRSTTGSDYWSDLADLHLALGLGVRHKDAVAIVPLTSKKDHEVMVVGKELGKDMVELVAAVVETYHNLLGVFCHSVSLALPPLEPQVEEESLPVVVHLVSRGVCTNKQADVSSFELWSFWSVNVNPLQTIAALKTTVNKLKS